MNARALLLALLACSSVACIDYGVVIDEDVDSSLPPPPLEDGGGPPPVVSDGATGDDGGGTDTDGGGTACVEEATMPSDTGPQIHFVTLNVDRNMVTVHPGDVVTWTNTDTMPHTVTAGAPGAALPPERGGFSSNPIQPSTRWAYRFCTPRRIVYFCMTHPQQMNNFRITVE